MTAEKIIIFVLLLWLIFSILYIRYLNKEYKAMMLLYKTPKIISERLIEEQYLERKNNFYDFQKYKNFNNEKGVINIWNYLLLFYF